MLTVSYIQLGDEAEMRCRSIGRPLMTYKSGLHYIHALDPM